MVDAQILKQLRVQYLGMCEDSKKLPFLIRKQNYQNIARPTKKQTIKQQDKHNEQLLFLLSLCYIWILFKFRICVYQLMEKTDQELYDIADRMLANLEKQYWETQQQEIHFDKECPENNEDLHEGYQMLQGDDENNQLNDSESSDENQEDNEQNQQNQENEEVEDKNASCPAMPAQQQQAQQPAQQEENDVGQLMEVFPMPQWVPEEKQVNINSEKIKEFTLKMSLPVPDWVNNEEMLKNRIMELFGQKK